MGTSSFKGIEKDACIGRYQNWPKGLLPFESWERENTELIMVEIKTLNYIPVILYCGGVYGVLCYWALQRYSTRLTT